MAPFPEEDLIEEISGYLNENYQSKYLVFNLAESKYDYNYFNSQVCFLTFR